MAEKKKSPPKKGGGKSKKKSSQPSVWSNIAPFVLGILAVFIAWCLIAPDTSGFVGRGVRGLLTGLLSHAAFAVPLVLALAAVFWRGDQEARRVHLRVINSVIFVCLLAVVSYTFVPAQYDGETLRSLWSPAQLYTSGRNELRGGGIIGGLLGGLIFLALRWASLVVVVPGLIISGLLVFKIMPTDAFSWAVAKIKSRHENGRERREENREYRRAYDAEQAAKKAAAPPPPVVRNVDIPIDSPSGNPHDSIDELYPNAQGEAGGGEADYTDQPAITKLGDAESGSVHDNLDRKGEHEEGKSVLRRVFLEDDAPQDGTNDVAPAIVVGGAAAAGAGLGRTSPFSLDVGDTGATLDIGEPANGEEDAIAISRRVFMPESAPNSPYDDFVPAPEYVLPPVNLLIKGENQNNQREKEIEAKQKAKTLEETLATFRVKARVMNVSHGPTVTRYEMAPDAGVKVRSVANLIDDISLALATAGIRIEAPIPDKPYIGIEVPNSIRETVHLRELIDNEEFRESGAKLTAAFGKDVSGEPVILDLAKMPHLLIAGTTGSGKSVCLNCLIMSLLYKASPKEVKMIMIDPKKVELNVYTKLPHLIVPVVSNTKKAAGALAWAVQEMENRYSMIEELKVRDIFSYNKATASDPEREFMPQLVIVIDELADLMMTARDSVEESICRIAQKGRAAGMHLIIGTQRPSVDVITGLIKANVPSRVAFSVSSQVDSRTIIDIGGAEKLIGRGDMLLAPVGHPKPERVQGAFVSDGEVEAVVDHIVAQCGEAEYDELASSQIEEVTGQLDFGKKKGGLPIDDEDGDGESDPMLKQAIELAIESGKISTSLIQRRLGLGYGRAAKLIDRMERMGIVSPPEGQKPRNVLISRGEWVEMSLNGHDFE
ncbi:MAG: FtsK/SpoIIIE domain-containing protein [Oscillospiraceae bacterium]|nr:FtsK/SpoIIIE domain-containing protein [Oscillospiraceae bacterium]